MTAAARPLALIALLLALAGAGSSTYTLRWGDTLGGVARRFGVPVAALTTANGIGNPDKVREGTKLTIPDKAAAQVAIAKPIATASPTKIHKVAKGETLGAIAKRYKVTVDEIKQLNEIKDERRVRDGRVLKLPDAAEGAATAGSETGGAADRPQPLCPVQNAGKFDFSNSFGAPRHGGRGHAGNDIFAKRGTAVLAPMGGTLRRADGSRAGFAFYIDGDDGNIYYGSHLDSIKVDGGARVERGAQIGTVGTTGNAHGTPPHLHFELKPGGGASVDPYTYLRSWCRGRGA